MPHSFTPPNAFSPPLPLPPPPHPPPSYIMAEALADRLAEAFAEKLHELTRRELWGYAPDENLTVDDMLKVKYQVRGRRGGGGGAQLGCCRRGGRIGPRMQAAHWCCIRALGWVPCRLCQARAGTSTLPMHALIAYATG